MQNLTTDRIRQLYVDADHYEPEHPRADLNAAEFDSWLTAHDAAIRRDALVKLNDEIDKLDSQLWQHARKVSEHIGKVVLDAQTDAVAAGADDQVGGK